MAPLPGLVKDATPPATDTVVSPITIPNGTILITTKQHNQIIDYLSGDAGPNFIPQSAINNLTSDLAAKEILSNKVVTIGTPGNDTNYPTEKAVRDALDLKEDSLGFTPEDSANKGAVSGYAALDGSQLLLLANFPIGTALQVLRRNAGNNALEFADAGSEVFTWSAPHDADGNNFLLSGGLIQFDDTATTLSQIGINLHLKVDAGAHFVFSVDGVQSLTVTDSDIRLHGGTLNLQSGRIIFDNAVTQFQQVGLDIQYAVDVGGAHVLRINNASEYTFDATQADFFGNKIVNVADPTNPQDVVTKAFGDANYIGVGSLDDLSDVTIAGTTINDILVSDVEGTWINRQGVFIGITGLGVQTQDLQMGVGNDIVLANSQDIRWVNANRRIFNDTSGFMFEVETGDSISLKFDTNIEYIFDATQADFLGNALVNAPHNHEAAAGGGQLTATLALDATGTKDSTTFLRGDNTWAVPLVASGIDSINGDSTSAQLIIGTTNLIVITQPVAGTTQIDIGTNVATSSDNLSFFASTTSAQLAGIINDETGTGLLVFGTSPIIITPTIASFINSTHNHEAAAGGGQLNALNALNATGTQDNTTFLRGDNTWAVPAGLEFLGPWTATHNAGNQTLSNIGELLLNDTAQIEWATNARIFYNDSVGLTFETDLDLVYIFKVGGFEQLRILSTAVLFQGNDIDNVNDFSLNGNIELDTASQLNWDLNSNRVIENTPDGFFFKVETGDFIKYQFQGIDGYVFDAAQADFLGNALVNAPHNHEAAAGGGQLNALNALNATGTKDNTTFLRGDNTWAVPSQISSLDDLSDVAITGTTINDLLVSDVEGAWINRQGVFTGITGLGVQTQDLVMGVGNNIIMSDSTEIRWVNGNRRIFNDTSGFMFEVEAGDAISLKFAANIEYTFDSTQADFMGNDILTTGKFKENGVDISPIGLHDIWFDAGGLNPVDSGGLASRIIGTGDNQKSLFFVPFTNGVDSFAVIKFKLPETYDNGDITVVINWTTETEAAGDVVWGIAGVAVSDNTDMTIAGANYGGEITITDTQQTINFSQDTPRSTSITLANTPADGDTIYLRIRRLGNSGSDTFTQDAQLLGVSVQLITDAAVSA